MRTVRKRETRPRFGAGTRGSGESGQGLVYVIVVSAMLLILLSALVGVLSKEVKWLVGSQRRSVLLHAADGAVDRALYALQKGGNWEGLPGGLVPGYSEDVTYSHSPGVLYTIQVQEGNWTPGVQIGDDEMERTITVRISNTVSGERKKVQVVIGKSTINSALFSGGQVYLGNNAKIFWGPVVSYSTGTDSIPLTGGIPKNPIFISAGWITIDGVKAKLTAPSSYSADPYAGVSVNEEADLGPTPELPVDQWRADAKTGLPGMYYYGGDGDTTCASCTFTSPSLTTGPATTEDSIVFFDSCNAKNFQPGDQLCSNCAGNQIGAEVNTKGNFCGSGILVVMGDLETKGTGCTMSLTMTPPPDCYPKYDAEDPFGTGDCAAMTNPTLFWHGTVYVAGELYSSGNKKVYGNVYAYKQAWGGGNMKIYYDTENKNIGYLGKSFSTRIWLERRPLPGDVFP